MMDAQPPNGGGPGGNDPFGGKQEAQDAQRDAQQEDVQDVFPMEMGSTTVILALVMMGLLSGAPSPCSSSFKP